MVKNVYRKRGTLRLENITLRVRTRTNGIVWDVGSIYCLIFDILLLVHLKMEAFGGCTKA